MPCHVQWTVLPRNGQPSLVCFRSSLPARDEHRYDRRQLLWNSVYQLNRSLVHCSSGYWSSPAAARATSSRRRRRGGSGSRIAYDGMAVLERPLAPLPHRTLIVRSLCWLHWTWKRAASSNSMGYISSRSDQRSHHRRSPHLEQRWPRRSSTLLPLSA
jgi:hypothetical protein